MLEEKDTYNELLSLKAMAQMIVEKANRLLAEKKERPVSTRISKNKKKKNMQDEIEKFLLKRKKTMIRRSINSNSKNKI